MLGVHERGGIAMKVIVEFVDAAGNPVAQPHPAQLAQWANEFAKALLRVRYPEITFKDTSWPPASRQS